jgi:hypothetical protein
MVRTAIDILLALGLATETKTRSMIVVEWKRDQENALARIEQVTNECSELRQEHQVIQSEIDLLNFALEQS